MAQNQPTSKGWRCCVYAALHLIMTCFVLVWLAMGPMSQPMIFSVTDGSGSRTVQTHSVGIWNHTFTLTANQSRAQTPSSMFHTSILEDGAMQTEGEQAAAAERTQLLMRGSLLHVFMACVTYIVVSYVVVPPFGRYAPTTIIPWKVPARLSWALQEMPTVLNVLLFVMVEYPAAYYAAHATVGKSEATLPFMSVMTEALWRCPVGLLLFLLHYLHRSFIYPLRVSSRSNDVPLHVTWSATIYCLLNGRLQVLANVWITAATPTRLWWRHAMEMPRDSPGEAADRWIVIMTIVFFAVGVALFFGGMYINVCSDYYLCGLKRQAAGQSTSSDPHQEADTTRQGATTVSSKGYRIPYGGWFHYVSCPNFFGEIVEWVGYATVVYASSLENSRDNVMMKRAFYRFHHDMMGIESSSFWLLSSSQGTWWQLIPSPTVWAAISFVVYVLANLVPRGRAHHQWYRTEFGKTYDALGRQAVFPCWR